MSVLLTPPAAASALEVLESVAKVPRLKTVTVPGQNSLGCADKCYWYCPAESNDTLLTALPAVKLLRVPYTVNLFSQHTTLLPAGLLKHSRIFQSVCSSGSPELVQKGRCKSA